MSPNRLSLVLLSLIAATGGVVPASAQSVNAQENTSDSTEGLDQIVVTGSRIPQRGLDSVSPIVEVDAADFDARGAMRFEELLYRMPQVVAAPESGTATGRAKGTAQLDLRGLGPERTLVLLNGRRMPYGSPDSLATDINQIPFALLEDVEVLTGGASAVYGSDALAGVVNFILRDDFEGLRFETTLGGYQHRNDNAAVQAAVRPWEEANPGEYVLPDETVWDGLSTMFSVVAGTNLGEDRGNITVYGTYRGTDEVLMSERDYTTCQLGNAPDGETFTCRPSPVDAPASFVNTGAAGLPSEFRVLDGEFVLRDPMTDRYNDQQFEQFLRDQQQYTFGGLAHFEINEHLIPFFETTYYSVDTAGDFSPTAVLNNGIVTGAGGFNCDNPFFSAQQADFLCSSRGLSTTSNYDPVTGAYLGPEDIATGVVINRRTNENGTRFKDIDLSTFRVVAGLRGEIVGSFQYEASATYADVTLNQWYDTINEARASQGLFAVIDQRVAADGSPLNPDTFGQPACAINVDDSPVNDNPACAPLDYFSTAGPSAAAVNFIDSQAFSFGNTRLTDVIASVSGDLGDYGLASPFADNGIGVAFGTERRRHTLDMDFDLETQARGLGTPVAGETAVSEFFGEVNIPLAEGRRGFENLALEGAYRYSDYDDSFSTDTYKIGLKWAPVSEVQFRGSYQRAVRAPNVIELFAGQTRAVRLQLAQNPDGSFDPCSGPDPFASFEECARTGVTAADYGNIADNSFVGELRGGNPDLGPETGETFAAGVVFRPSFAPGLTATVDRFDIKVENLVGIINPNITIRQCMENGDPLFCDLIHRGAGGTLFATEDSYIATLNVNTGSVETSGWDLSLNYVMDLSELLNRDLGELNLNLVGTLLDEYVIQPLPTSTADETFDCAGYHGFACRHPKPEWRHVASAGWQTPWSDIWIGGTWRHIAAVDISRKSSQPALAGAFFPVQDLSSANYLDVSFAWLPEGNLSLRAGINNLLDRDPPLTTEFVGDVGGNGNSYLSFYDSMGRFLFMSATVQF